MYLQHYLPESNLLNPAVPLQCRWYVGMPALSSLHVNAASSGFSINELFQNQGGGNYSGNIDNVINGLHRRNFLGAEFHLQWLALGYRYNNHSFYFTISEKNNIPFTYPKTFIQLIWRGNSMFEGENAGLKGTGLYFNHYREFAFTYSNYQRSGTVYGIRAKLLFGKLNLATKSTDIGVVTDETTFNLNFHGDLDINSSLPLNIDYRDNLVDEINIDENASLMPLIFNRKNPGLAIDAGIIYPYSDELELSASIIDLGAIMWRSNLNNFVGEGDFLYEGALEETDNVDNYVEHISESIVDSFFITTSQENYTTFLPPRLLAGAKYEVNDYFNAAVKGEALIYKSKILPSLTFSGHYRPLENVHLLASYSLQYSSFNHLGLGVVLGRNPIQFYAITDNISGIFWPLNSRNINLRIGLNIIFGCNIKDINNFLPGSLRGNCSCYGDSRKPKRRR